jgi:hypothetical protein
MTLLTMVQNAADEIGIPQPGSVISSTDQSVIQLLRMAQRHGKMLVTKYQWEELTVETTHTSVATESQGAITTIFGADFDHIISDTIFNRTQNKRILGPLSASQWQRELSNTASIIDEHYRIRGGEFLVTPTMTAGETVALEYMSAHHCQATGGGATKDSFTVDSDVSRLSEELTTLGIIVRFMKAKGLDYSEHFREHELLLNQRMGVDGGKPRINLAGRAEPNPRFVNMPDGDWPIS